MTHSVVGQRRSSRALPRAKLAPKKRKRSRPLFGGLLPAWSTTAFWIPVNPLHLRSMLSKSMRCAENCKACSWHWSTGRAQFFSTTMPDHIWYNQHLKNWMNWAVKFCPITIFTWPLATDYHFFKHLDNFLQGKCSHSQQDLENAFQEFVESWSTDFYATGVNKHFFFAKSCQDA